MDPRFETLAKNIVSYSCSVEKGENVLINCNGTAAFPLVKALVREIYKVGAYPFVDIHSNIIDREFIAGVSEEQFAKITEIDNARMDIMDAYIGIGCNDNTAELSDIPGDKMSIYSRLYSNPILETRLKKKWVVLRYPNNSLAQSAGTSLDAFEDFYFKVCNLDYSKMSKAMDNLVDLMNKTDKVRIVGKGTDLSFSIKDIPAIKCAGEMNIPDGEVYTAPVRDSVNGVISYNTPTEYQGVTYSDVTLKFENGKIVDAKSNDTERINMVFDTDDGARYVGEFAIGVNPFITKAMKNILFDEKIRGSIHFTPGNAYDDADNGNRSAIHWDLVLIQTEEYGGGEIYFDDVLIRKNGVFVIDELKCLNPENLM